MRKIWKYLLLVLQLALILSLLRGIYSSLSAEKRVKELVVKKDKLVDEQAKLNIKKSEVESEYHMEKVARDQLHLVKPGEVVVVVGDIKPADEREESQNIDRDSNIMKWVNVFVAKN